jgi:hypothetical protein
MDTVFPEILFILHSSCRPSRDMGEAGFEPGAAACQPGIRHWATTSPKQFTLCKTNICLLLGSGPAIFTSWQRQYYYFLFVEDGVRMRCPLVTDPPSRQYPRQVGVRLARRSVCLTGTQPISPSCEILRNLYEISCPEISYSKISEKFWKVGNFLHEILNPSKVGS